MNCFSHAWRFLDRDPYFVVGTCIPDWLSMVARKTRAREKAACQLTAEPDQAARELAGGIVQHHRDDHWFHASQEFVALNLQFAIELRELLGADAGFRPNLAGHILIEMLLDAYLTHIDASRLDAYYEKVAMVQPQVVQSVVNRLATLPTDRIAGFVPRFLKEAYLYDYGDDQRTRYRLNRVLSSVKLVPLPETFLEWLPEARRRVYELAPAMLTPPTDAHQNGFFKPVAPPESKL